jgi:predicted phosphoribosyltransferase
VSFENLAVSFHDRYDAGRQLAAALADYAGRTDVLVLALPRGGVPVASEVARALGAPLDIFLVRKLGAPGQPELAMGAVASGGLRVLNDEVVRYLGIGEDFIEHVAAEEMAELERRERLYRGQRPPPQIAGCTIILLDDGLATGSSMRAAVRALRQQQPAAIVVAVPVGAARVCRDLAAEADAVVCLYPAEQFFAVGEWYDDFQQTMDEEVSELLARAAPS